MQELIKLMEQELDKENYKAFRFNIEKFNCILIKIGLKSKKIIAITTSISDAEKIMYFRSDIYDDIDRIWETIKMYSEKIIPLHLLEEIKESPIKEYLKEEEYERLLDIIKEPHKVRQRKKINYINKNNFI